MKISLSKIAYITGGKLIGEDGSKIVSNLITDSRSLMNADDTLFFALKGERQDGHRFIDELKGRGVKAFVVSDADKVSKAGVVLIHVPDTTVALQKLAAYKRSLFKGKVLGVTGSNGKTVFKEWLAQLLNGKATTSRSPKSYNSQIGVPLSIWMSDLDSEVYLIEAGISEVGEMEKLKEIISPEIGVITNIGPAHQENFDSYEEKIDEKLKLFAGAETLIYGIDDERITEGIRRNHALQDIAKISWSLKGAGDINASVLSQTTRVTFLAVKYRKNRLVLEIPFVDKASIENSLSCFAALVALGYNPADFVEGFGMLEPVAMRLELKKGRGGSLLINDAYNSDLGSLDIALDFLNQQGLESTIKHTVILSDIIQSGDDKTELYKKVNRLLMSKNVDSLIGVGGEISSCASLFEMETRFFDTTEALLERLAFMDLNNQAILLKGARYFEFEKISDRLEEKVHRTTLEINLNALIHNFNYFKSLLKPRTKVMGMVKAFAYGSGSFEIARLLQYHGIDYLAVAVADEGVALRRAGISVPIVVMTPEAKSFHTMISHQLEPEIYSLDVLHAFDRALVSQGIHNYPVHLKIDSGMHRLGFLENELDELIAFLKEHQSLQVASVFSHLAASDEALMDHFTMEQIEMFKRLSTKVEEALEIQTTKHILNSAGTERFAEHQMDMVRLGIGMYGVSSVEQANLEYVSALKTRVVQVKHVPRNETVGYGRRGVLERDSEIAILPVGYADGLNRLLGNGKGYVLINGRKAPYVGNICMDLCMVDVTDMGVQCGEEVTVFGKDLSISVLAEWMGTIPYEVITSISARVKRVFVRE